jgi:hypothetical protein
MRDLETQIAQWRRDMRGAGIRSATLLDELESHLRDDIEHQMRTGADAESAFGAAAAHIGRAGNLRGEFQKIQSTLSMNLSPATHRKLRELLVVIALVAIQVGLLLPIVHKLKTQQALTTFDIVAACALGVGYVIGIVCYVRKRRVKA